MPLSLNATPRAQRWFTSAAHWPDAVLPAYDGGSIGNLPASILNAFSSPGQDNNSSLLSPLQPSVLHPGFLDGARVVVLIVVDGFGADVLGWAEAEGALRHLSQAQMATRMTSVFPSTTAAALTTLQTGLPPAQHGMAGYTLYMAAQQAVINMISWKPVGGMPVRLPLPQPKGFLGVPTLYDLLECHDIPSTVVSNLAFMDSPLTRVHSPGVPYSGHRTPAEFAGMLLREVEKPGRRFVFGYWDGYDALSHTHGPESAICLDELHLLDAALGRGFFDRLGNRSGDVAVLVTADHGHAPISIERTHSLKKILREHSPARLIPTGDRRAMGLAFDDLPGLQALREIAGDDGVVLPVHDAVKAGLYGPGELYPGLEARIGKTLLLAKDDASFVYPQSNNPTAGGHGSLTSREMLVPLLGWRF